MLVNRDSRPAVRFLERQGNGALGRFAIELFRRAVRRRQRQPPRQLLRQPRHRPKDAALQDEREGLGRQIEGIGVIPDVRVDLILADLRQGRDRMLETAVRELSRPPLTARLIAWDGGARE